MKKLVTLFAAFFCFAWLWAAEKISCVQLWEGGPYWAECNVGADKPEESGYYFWWGDTVGYEYVGGQWNKGDEYNEANQWLENGKWVSSKGEEANVSPFYLDYVGGEYVSICPTYNITALQLIKAGYIDDKGNLRPTYDAATAHLGASWRMPTYEEFSDLIDKCDAVWTTCNGVEGVRVTGRGEYASKSIFFPAAGQGGGDALYRVGSFGEYFSSTPHHEWNPCAWGFDIHRPADYYPSIVAMDNDTRCDGLTIRAVCDINLEHLSDGGPYTETVDGVTYTYSISNGEATIGNGTSAAIPTSTSGALVIPSTLGGCPVTTIGRYAFSACSSLTSVTIPSGVTTIWEYAFSGCSSLTSVTIPSSVTTIGGNDLAGCSSLDRIDISDLKAWCECVRFSPVFSINGNCRLFCNGAEITNLVIPSCVTTIGAYAFAYSSLASVTIPSSVTTIGLYAFYHCSSLTEVRFEGDIPMIDDGAFAGSPWYERGIYRILANASAEGAATVTVKQEVTHYVLNSVQPSFVIPATYDTGFVNCIAEVKGGCVAIPATWTVNYPKFTEKFGSDFTKALGMKTGKIAAGGREMLVWEDYVAGTDPTNPNDKFTASMTLVDGKVVVSYTPQLDAERAAMRKYTTYGKVKLTDVDWTEVPEGHEAEYNFFKVTVEMK